MVELQNEDKLNEIIDKKIGDEIDGSIISEVFEGYKFKITGGFDKDGFAMKNGILSQAKKKVLLTKGCSLFRFRKGYHRTGIRIRRLVRGCIVSHDIKNLHLKIIKKGPKEIEGLTTEKDAQPKRLGPKRATRILKEFGLYSTYQEKKKDKEQRKNLRFMITKFAPKREVKTKNGKTYVKRPKIQRLITPDRLRRKRLLKKFHEERKAKAKKEEEDYRALIKKIFSKKNKVKKEAKSKKEKKEKKDEEPKKRRFEPKPLTEEEKLDRPKEAQTLEDYLKKQQKPKAEDEKKEVKRIQEGDPLKKREEQKVDILGTTGTGRKKGKKKKEKEINKEELDLNALIGAKLEISGANDRERRPRKKERKHITEYDGEKYGYYQYRPKQDEINNLEMIKK